MFHWIAWLKCRKLYFYQWSHNQFQGQRRSLPFRSHYLWNRLPLPPHLQRLPIPQSKSKTSRHRLLICHELNAKLKYRSYSSSRLKSINDRRTITKKKDHNVSWREFCQFEKAKWRRNEETNLIKGERLSSEDQRIRGNERKRGSKIAIRTRGKNPIIPKIIRLKEKDQRTSRQNPYWNLITCKAVINIKETIISYKACTKIKIKTNIIALTKNGSDKGRNGREE